MRQASSMRGFSPARQHGGGGVRIQRRGRLREDLREIGLCRSKVPFPQPQHRPGSQWAEPVGG